MNSRLVAGLLAFAATTLFYAPAFAQSSPADFTGPRVGATIGFADDDFGGTEAFTYGVDVGYDFDLGTAVVGATLEYQESGEEGFGRDISAVGRIGAKVGSNALVYGLVGYTNLSVEGTDLDLDGARIGAGVEIGSGSGLFGKAEYRYSDYEQGVDGHQMLVGLGFRF
jgi:outer membrane immunogenic protein